MTEAKYVIVGWDFDAEGNDELALKAGDVVTLISKRNDNWWEGELDGRRGLFPASYVRFLENVLEESSTQKSAEIQTVSLTDVHGIANEREVQQMYPEEMNKDQDVRVSEYDNEDGTNYYLQNQVVEESGQYISELRHEKLYYEQENFVESQDAINIPSYNKPVDQESIVDHILRSSSSEGQLSVEHVTIQHIESQSIQEITEDATAEPMHQPSHDREIQNDSNDDVESAEEDSSEEEQADHKHYPRLLYAGEQPSQEELLLQNDVDGQGEQSAHDQYLDEQLSEDEMFPEDLLREQIFEREVEEAERNVWDIMEHYHNGEGLSDNYTDNVSLQADADEVATAVDEGYHPLASDDEEHYSELHSSLNVEDYENTPRSASFKQDDLIDRGVEDLKLEDDYEDNPFVSSDETLDQPSQSRTTNDLEDNDIDVPKYKTIASTMDGNIYNEDGQASLYSTRMGETAWDTSLLNIELHRRAVVYDNGSFVETQTLQGNQLFEQQVINNEHEEMIQLPSRDSREQDDDNTILNATVPIESVYDDVTVDNQRLSESGDQRQRPPSVIHSRQPESDRNQQLNLPKGWWSSVDDSGAVFYYNEFTNESQWEMPVETMVVDSQTINKTEEERNEEAISNDVEPELTEGYGLSENLNESNYPMTEESVDLRSYSRTKSDHHHMKPIPPEKVYYNHTRLGEFAAPTSRTELSILQLDRIPAQWIHKQGCLSMKTESPEGDKLSSWKLYWVVLCDVYIIFYKSSPDRNKKTEKKVMPVGIFDVHKDRLEFAGRQHTKQKHVFILNACDGMRMFMQAQSDSEARGWVDIINVNQEERKKSHKSNNEPEIESLLRVCVNEINDMKINKKVNRGLQLKASESVYFKKTEKEDAGLVKKKSKKFGASNAASRKRNWFFQNKPSSNYDKKTVQNDLIFGGLLENSDGRIPHIVENCIKIVDERGLQSVGLYRLSGNTATIQKLRKQVNDGESINLYDEPDINVITGLLKLYFRELANPLIPFEYYDMFIEAAKITDYNEKMYRLHSLIHSLPQVNFETLETLMRHLSRVTSYSEENKMEPPNLAIVFAPNLIRPFEAGIESIMDSGLQSQIIETLIEQCEWFFDDDDDDDDDDDGDNEESVKISEE